MIQVLKKVLFLEKGYLIVEFFLKLRFPEFVHHRETEVDVASFVVVGFNMHLLHYFQHLLVILRQV